MLTNALPRYAFVDWDDTLKVTNALYDKVSAANACLVLERLPQAGISPAELVRRIHEIDLGKARAVGLRPQNYPEAWVEGYEALARECGVAPCADLCRELYDRAAAVPHMPQDDYPGARDLLRWLREQGFEITVWTTGDENIQKAKVDRSGFRALVDRVCVVPEKSAAALAAALGSRDRRRTCVIGNSPRADIVPALHLDVWAIHVLQDTWAYDVASFDSDHPRYLCVRALPEIPALLASVLLCPAS